MILYTLYKNSYIDIAHLESTKGITCYVNSTNRCTCSCTFCLRQTKEMIENNSLWLKEEPTVDEIIQEFEKYNLKVIRFTNIDIDKNFEGVCNTIDNIVRESLPR